MYTSFSTSFKKCAGITIGTVLPFDEPTLGIALRNILVVEDEALVALDMSGDLENWGYSITGVVSTLEKALLSAKFKRPDVAIVDVSLELEEDGVTVARVLKEKFNTHIIFLTAHSDMKTRVRINSVDPLGCLFKPYSAEALRDLLENEVTR